MRTHERPAPGTTCAVCGFRFEPVTPTQAVTSLFDLPSAYRAALDVSDDDVRARRDADGWSAIEYAAHAAEVLHSTRKRLVLVFERDDRPVTPPHLEAVRASARTSPPELVLASVSAACHDLARLVGAVPDAAWDRAARRGDEIVTARDLLTDALHEAHHHALDARAACRAGSPDAPLLAPA
jgi:hypothetical protein